MQVGLINTYSFTRANQSFQSGGLKKVATVEELLADATKCNVIIDKIDRTTGASKGIGSILLELSAKLSPKPNFSPLGVLQSNERGRGKLFGQLEQMIFERAAQLGINIQGKKMGQLTIEIVETEKILDRFKKYGVSPRSQDLAELRAEAAEIERTYKDAESRGIRTEGKDLQTVLRELSCAPKTPNPKTGNPHAQDGAKRVLGQVGLVKKPRSIKEILESSPKTREDAIMVFNALGFTLKTDKAQSLKREATDAEIKAAYRELAHIVHTDKDSEKLKYIQSLNEAKDILLPKH